jgi:hypothetical protein
LLIVVSLVSAGCGEKARPATVPDSPPLAMPIPPPRVFAPVVEEPIAATPAAPETAAAEPPQVQPRRPPRRPAAASTEPEKTEPAPAPVQPAPEPPRELRAASTPADEEAARKIRALINQATQTLRGVDYGKLSIAGREQYDQAKGFSDQAEEALKQRNYVYAETLADKAAKLSAELPRPQGR